MAKMLTLACVAAMLTLSSCNSVKSSSSVPVLTKSPPPAAVEAVSWWHLPSTNFIP
jgi:hypothetical protein